MARFYVTMTWEDWPQGGSWVDYVEVEPEAPDGQITSEMVSRAAKKEMALARSLDSEGNPNQEDAQEILETFGGDWFLADHFNVDEFMDREAARSLENIRKMIGDRPRKPTADSSPSMG